jgi:hypothetical protein
MPTKESEFLAWSENFIAVVNLHKTEWNIAQDKVTELQTLHQAFAVLYEKCTTAEARKLDFQEKSEAKTALQQKEEHLVGQLQAADFMTDSFRQELGITIKDTHPTPRQEPKTKPEVRPEPEPPGVVVFRFWAQGSARGAKDPDATGFELCWALLSQPPASHAELVHSLNGTNRTVRLEFDLADRGKTLYYMARWRGNGEKHGPWTEIGSVIVP